jgi:hypothetical protein
MRRVCRLSLAVKRSAAQAADPQINASVAIKKITVIVLVFI